MSNTEHLERLVELNLNILSPGEDPSGMVRHEAKMQRDRYLDENEDAGGYYGKAIMEAVGIIRDRERVE